MSTNPFDESKPSTSFGTGGLGSLAQSARQKQLKSARGVLIAIGILTLGWNLFCFAGAENEVKVELDKQVQELHRKGMIEDQKQLAEVRNTTLSLVRLIYGGAAALGALFIVFGIFVNTYPVPITIASLVLYIGAAAAFGLLDPMSLLQGFVIKIIIVVALAKSIQSALAYEREKALEQSPISQFG